MKKLTAKRLKALMMLMAVFTCSLVFSQPPGGGQRGGQQGPPKLPNSKQIKTMVSDLAKEVNLTDGQETRVLALYESHFKKVEGKMSSGSRPDRTEMAKLKTTFENSIKSLLTKEQKTKYLAFLKKQASKRNRG